MVTKEGERERAGELTACAADKTSCMEKLPFIFVGHMCNVFTTFLANWRETLGERERETLK